MGPEGFAGLRVETAEVAFDFLFVDGAVEAIEVALVKDGRVDVVLEFLVGPDGSGCVFFRIEEGGPFAPPGGEVKLIVDDERISGIFTQAGGPVDFPEDLAIGLGNDVHRFVAKEGEGGLVAAGEGNGGGVSAREGRGVPEDFSGVFVEGDAGLVGVEEESVADNERSGGEAPGGHGGLGFSGKVGGPAGFSGGFVPAGDESLLAEGVERCAFDDGWGIGATGVVFRDEVLGIGFTPDGFAGGGVEALDEVIAFEITEGIGFAVTDGDTGVAEMDFGGPEEFGAGGRPFV